jgi:hypothetical protein
MKISLNPDKKDHIWILFGKVLKVIDSRTFQEELARNGLKKIESHQIMLKMVLLSIFFKLELNNVYNQVDSKSKLRKFLGIEDLPRIEQIREIYST